MKHLRATSPNPRFFVTLHCTQNDRTNFSNIILGSTSFTGGISTMPGTLLGALIIAVLNNGLTLLNRSYFWQSVVKGLVIIVAVTIDRLHRRDAR